MTHNLSMPDCLSSLLLRPWCTVPGSQSDTRPPRRGRAGSTDSRPRRAWLPVRRAPTAIQHVLHRRLAASPSHRGITGASGRLTAGLALWQALFHRQTSAHQHKSGGRQPPVASKRTGGKRALRCKRLRTSESRAAGVSPRGFATEIAPAFGAHCRQSPGFSGSVPAIAFAKPRRADARRSSSPTIATDRLRFSIVARASRVHGRNVSPRDRRSPLQARLANHGGLTPAALDSDARHARGIRFPVPERRSHPGGLTPAAPVDVRLCIVEGDFFSQRKSCTKSDWRA
jgi:hypothetical protein